MAFEKLLDVEVPRRAEYIRVLSGELNRIASHSLFLGWMALDLGGLTPILWSFIERDEIVDMLAALTGQRMLFNYFRIGGVNGDLNHEFMSRLGDWMSRATEQIEAGIDAAQRERDLRPPDARPRRHRHARRRCGWCMTGPNLRATGVPVRRPAGASVHRSTPSSTSTSRPAPRATAWPATCSGWTRSSRACGSSTSASTRCPTARSWPSCRACSARVRAAPRPAIEGPRGQYAAYAISDGTDQPFRMRIHDPSFIHLQAVGVLMPGHLIADTMAIMASLDPIMGGVDK